MPGVVVSLDTVVIGVVLDTVLSDVRVVGVCVVASGISGLRVVGGVGCVHLLEVVTVGRLLLGFTVEPAILGVVTELLLSQFSLGVWALVSTVFMGTVPVLRELGASVVTWAGSVSGVMEVVASIDVGRMVLSLGELGMVTISVVEGRTENGVVGAHGTLVLGSTSTHGGVGELGTIVMVTVSGQGVVGRREI